MLARTLSARAALEHARGDRRGAADLARTALRLSYACHGLRDIAISHHNLSTYLDGLGGPRAEQRAHRLAAALICRLASMASELANTVRLLTAELRKDGTLTLPCTVTQVITVTEQAEGIRLGALLTSLQPDTGSIDVALAEILRVATTTATTDDPLQEPE